MCLIDWWFSAERERNEGILCTVDTKHKQSFKGKQLKQFEIAYLFFLSMVVCIEGRKWKMVLSKYHKLHQLIDFAFCLFTSFLMFFFSTFLCSVICFQHPLFCRFLRYRRVFADSSRFFLLLLSTRLLLGYRFAHWESFIHQNVAWMGIMKRKGEIISFDGWSIIKDLLQRLSNWER